MYEFRGKGEFISALKIRDGRFTKSIWLWACAVLCLVTQSCPTLCDPMECSPSGSSVHGNSPGKNTEVCCHALLQGIFPTQGSNLVSLMSPALTVGSLPLATCGSESESCSVCPTLWDPMDCSQPGSPIHGNYAGQNTGLCSHSPLQGIIPTREWIQVSLMQADSLSL